MQQFFFIAAGGAFGSLARFALSRAVQHSINSLFPWGTMTVNLAGAFVIGVCAELFERAILPTEFRSFMIIGVLGGFTTLSSLSLETIELLRDGEWVAGLANALGSIAASLILTVLGIAAVRWLLHTAS